MTDLLQGPPPSRNRRRRGLLLGAGVAVVLVAAVAVAYLAFFQGSSEERLSLTPSEDTNRSAAGITADTAAGRWAAVAGSEAGYRVREKLSGSPPRATPWGARRRCPAG